MRISTFAARVRPATLAVGIVGLALAGCGTPEATDTVGAGQYGPRDTGTYPNLNIVPKPAAEQFTPAEKAARRAQLISARQRSAGGMVPTNAAAEQARMRAIGTTEQARVLREIEAGE